VKKVYNNPDIPDRTAVVTPENGSLTENPGSLTEPKNSVKLNSYTDNLSLILIEDDCPDFVDPMTRQKYTLKKGDIANIPKWICDLLVGGKKARRIESSA